jgi:NAD(P)-dependent dehydrogenase (short-subunit alcohol dehydrogenase family)
MTAHSVYPSLRDKRVVVTGGGSSIGAAIVERFDVSPTARRRRAITSAT